MRLPCFLPLLLAWLMAFSPPATADNLTVTPSQLEMSLAPGAAWNVTGTITNLSGADLLSTDLFLTFSGYPYDSLAPQQTLGSVEFIIPDKSATDPVDLFSLSLLPGAVQGRSYSIDVFAMSRQGDFSNVGTFVVAVVPEPAQVLLMVAGLLALALRQVRRRALAVRTVSNQGA